MGYFESGGTNDIAPLGSVKKTGLTNPVIRLNWASNILDSLDNILLNSKFKPPKMIVIVVILRFTAIIITSES